MFFCKTFNRKCPDLNCHPKPASYQGMCPLHASPVCIPCPKENHVSLPSNVFFCVYIPFFMHQNFGNFFFKIFFLFKGFFL